MQITDTYVRPVGNVMRIEELLLSSVALVMTGYPAGGVVKQLQRSAAERSAGRLIRLRAEVAGAQELVYPSRISAAETATTVMSL